MALLKNHTNINSVCSPCSPSSLKVLVNKDQAAIFRERQHLNNRGPVIDDYYLSHSLLPINIDEEYTVSIDSIAIPDSPKIYINSELIKLAPLPSTSVSLNSQHIADLLSLHRFPPNNNYKNSSDFENSSDLITNRLLKSYKRKRAISNLYNECYKGSCIKLTSIPICEETGKPSQIFHIEPVDADSLTKSSIRDKRILFRNCLWVDDLEEKFELKNTKETTEKREKINVHEDGFSTLPVKLQELSTIFKSIFEIGNSPYEVINNIELYVGELLNSILRKQLNENQQIRLDGSYIHPNEIKKGFKKLYYQKKIHSDNNSLDRINNMDISNNSISDSTSYFDINRNSVYIANSWQKIYNQIHRLSFEKGIRGVICHRMKLFLNTIKSLISNTARNINSYGTLPQYNKLQTSPYPSLGFCYSLNQDNEQNENKITLPVSLFNNCNSTNRFNYVDCSVPPVSIPLPAPNDKTNCIDILSPFKSNQTAMSMQETNIASAISLLRLFLYIELVTIESTDTKTPLSQLIHCLNPATLDILCKKKSMVFPIFQRGITRFLAPFLKGIKHSGFHTVKGASIKLKKQSHVKSGMISQITLDLQPVDKYKQHEIELLAEYDTINPITEYKGWHNTNYKVVRASDVCNTYYGNTDINSILRQIYDIESSKIVPRRRLMFWSQREPSLNRLVHTWMIINPIVIPLKNNEIALQTATGVVIQKENRFYPGALVVRCGISEWGILLKGDSGYSINTHITESGLISVKYKGTSYNFNQEWINRFGDKGMILYKLTDSDLYDDIIKESNTNYDSKINDISTKIATFQQNMYNMNNFESKNEGNRSHKTLDSKRNSYTSRQDIKSELDDHFFEGRSTRNNKNNSRKNELKWSLDDSKPEYHRNRESIKNIWNLAGSPSNSSYTSNNEIQYVIDSYNLNIPKILSVNNKNTYQNNKITHEKASICNHQNRSSIDFINNDSPQRIKDKYLSRLSHLETNSQRSRSVYNKDILMQDDIVGQSLELLANSPIKKYELIKENNKKSIQTDKVFYKTPISMESKKYNQTSLRWTSTVNSRKSLIYSRSRSLNCFNSQKINKQSTMNNDSILCKGIDNISRINSPQSIFASVTKSSKQHISKNLKNTPSVAILIQLQKYKHNNWYEGDFAGSKIELISGDGWFSHSENNSIVRSHVDDIEHLKYNSSFYRKRAEIWSRLGERRNAEINKVSKKIIKYRELRESLVQPLRDDHAKLNLLWNEILSQYQNIKLNTMTEDKFSEITCHSLLNCNRDPNQTLYKSLKSLYSQYKYEANLYNVKRKVIYSPHISETDGDLDYFDEHSEFRLRERWESNNIEGLVAKTLTGIYLKSVGLKSPDISSSE